MRKVNYESLNKDISRKLKQFCKPCWELKYCPYGMLVEDFPVVPGTRQEMEEHQGHLLKILQTGHLDNGEKISADRRRILKLLSRDFHPDEYPRSIPKSITVAGCQTYGHICPVYFSGSYISESKYAPKKGRSINFSTKLKIVRRDDSTCQICGNHLKPEEIEFDHKIPLSIGGNSDEKNLQVACKTCNRTKGAKIYLD